MRMRVAIPEYSHGRFLKACGYSVSTLASSSFSTFNHQKQGCDKTDSSMSALLSVCLPHKSSRECRLAAMHSTRCTYSSPFSSDILLDMDGSNSSRVNSSLSRDDSSSTAVQSVPSVETDRYNNRRSVLNSSGLCDIHGALRGHLATLGPGQVLPSAVDYLGNHDIVSYCVIGDLILAFKLNAAVSSLNVTVGQCTRIWDQLLTLHHQRGWYVRICLCSDKEEIETKQEKTTFRTCCCDPVFNETFDYTTDCKDGYLEASLWMSRGVLSSSEVLGTALISLEQLLPHFQTPDEEEGLRCEYKLLAERRAVD